MTALGFLAPLVPALDLVNHGRPFAELGAVMLFALVFRRREVAADPSDAALTQLLGGLVLVPWARAADTGSNAAPALRLVTYNLTAGNDRFDEIAISSSRRAPISCPAGGELRGGRPPHPRSRRPIRTRSFADTGFSARRCWRSAVADRRPGDHRHAQPLMVWARFEWNKRRVRPHRREPRRPARAERAGCDVARLSPASTRRARPQIAPGALNLHAVRLEVRAAQQCRVRPARDVSCTWPARWPLVPDGQCPVGRQASERARRHRPPLGSDPPVADRDIAFVK